MYDVQSRREFLKSVAAMGVVYPVVSSMPLLADTPKNPNEKLNIAVVGVAARGAANLNGVKGENIVALCDIDSERLNGAAKEFPSAALYDDYRRIFDHDLDGVVCSTPDHMHAFVVCEALKRGLPVYCEKPLTHSISEARKILKLVDENNNITQMGNQIHSTNNYRRVVEQIQSGVIGDVRQVHVFLPAVEHFRAGKRVQESTPPDNVSYDLWLGPAPYRPFDVSHFHFDWRYWWDFGGGQIADFWCHYTDLAYWALDLKYPTRISAIGEKGHDGENEVPRHLQVEYDYPARGEKPPVKLTWSQGKFKPEGAEVMDKSHGVLFEGDKGRLWADYSNKQIVLQDGSEAVPVKPYIADSIGHHAEWLQAIRGNGTTASPFSYGAVLTEGGHLGNLSYRLGKEILWDAEAMKATNAPEADEIISRQYRKGWTLDV
ncbi:Inositol 2-dehydrogenase [Polystyrenella longa]|uniref:Inositol 2-dehydrogenase n=1 Tax=Polystyrenella longa TaxID=2528007 RepID=A0A518CNL3_9PLAN|nr:Gfo/Idh/MocA family oxidoreductase [Polystyrenella longa]QDU80809.1 Inositol 2-dehydrogenase [Polystyrenella longa]